MHCTLVPCSIIFVYTCFKIVKLLTKKTVLSTCINIYMILFSFFPLSLLRGEHMHYLERPENGEQKAVEAKCRLRRMLLFARESHIPWWGNGSEVFPDSAVVKVFHLNGNILWWRHLSSFYNLSIFSCINTGGYPSCKLTTEYRFSVNDWKLSATP